MGSVARLLKEYRYEVKALRGGRYEVRGGNGVHTFASDNELWRWMASIRSKRCQPVLGRRVVSQFES
jgi:hypothetical protein